MVREVSYRKFQKHHGNDPEPPVISTRAYKAGSFIKCPLRWTWGAIKAIHEGAELYMISLLEDANLLAIHARNILGYPGISSWHNVSGGERLELFRIQGLE